MILSSQLVSLVLLALAPVGKTGASFDADAHRIEAHGVAVTDPRAPSADVARVKAERQARVAASDKLRRALTALGYRADEAATNALLEHGQARNIDYGADGSVTLDLQLDVKDVPGLALPAASSHKKAR
ncbi:MAG: hypothetical protein ABI321_09180 [Polyangia bacterium]